MPPPPITSKVFVYHYEKSHPVYDIENSDFFLKYEGKFCFFYNVSNKYKILIVIVLRVFFHLYLDFKLCIIFSDIYKPES